MTEKVKKDAKNLQEKTRVIIVVAVIAAIFGVMYVVCLTIGGGAKDFATAAAPWVLIGIGVAGAITLLQTTEETHSESKH